METYIKPVAVHSPKRYWTLIHVIFDGGIGGDALAIGRWNNQPVLAMRWNGSKENPLGNPQSRGLPTWFIVPDQYWKQILEGESFKSINEDTLILTRNFLELRREYFLTPCPNSRCPQYLKPALQTFHFDKFESTLQELKRSEFKFYHIICDASWKPSQAEKDIISALLRRAITNSRRASA